MFGTFIGLAVGAVLFLTGTPVLTAIAVGILTFALITIVEFAIMAIWVGKGIR